MFYFCFNRPDVDVRRDCYHIPVDIRKWTEFFPPEPPILRILQPVRIALITLLMGPRPHPWRQAGVRISPEVESDLLALSAMHSLAEGLSPALRGSVQDSIWSAAQQVPLPQGATVRA